MQTRINEKYINSYIEKIKKIKLDIPFLSISPRIDNKNNNIGIIFINGLNGTKTMMAYFNHKVFEDKWLFTFDNRAQGDNHNYPSKNYRKYVNDCEYIIDALIAKKTKIKYWFIIGESWGGALALLLSKQYANNKIKGYFTWNMPCKIINNSPRKGWNAFSSNLKVLSTHLFGIPTKTDNPFNPSLTNNQTLLRVIKLYEKQPIHSGVTIAAWKTFLPAWEYIIKNYNNVNFQYIQSLDDVMADEKKYKELATLTNKLIIFEKGTHMLAFDKNEDTKLFKQLNLFINTTFKYNK